MRVVLVAPRNPLNIGAVARAMSNFGFTRLRLVNPYDLAFREAVSAVKSHYILEQAEVFASTAEAIADCSLVVGSTALGNRDLQVPLYRLEAGGTRLREHLWTGMAALLFGSEKFGLSNEDMSHCHWLFRIPTREAHGSMNLGQAAAITLYELRRNEASATLPFEVAKPASGAELERVTALLMEILRASGYINERTAESAEFKLRRLVLRMGMQARDADTWAGILRQIRWKLQGNSSAADTGPEGTA